MREIVYCAAKKQMTLILSGGRGRVYIQELGLGIGTWDYIGASNIQMDN